MCKIETNIKQNETVKFWLNSEDLEFNKEKRKRLFEHLCNLCAKSLKLIL